MQYKKRISFISLCLFGSIAVFAMEEERFEITNLSDQFANVPASFRLFGIKSKENKIIIFNNKKQTNVYRTEKDGGFLFDVYTENKFRVHSYTKNKEGIFSGKHYSLLFNVGSGEINEDEKEMDQYKAKKKYLNSEKYFKVVNEKSKELN